MPQQGCRVARGGSARFFPGWVLVLSILAALIGCGEGFENRVTRQSGGKPFDIGKADRYRAAGVHQGLRQSRGVWIVTFSNMVVALSAACPHDGEGTYFDDMTQQFKCPQCAARYDANGLPRAPKGAEKALVRLRIEPKDKEARGADVELRVNGKIRFRYEENEWSNRFSFYEFDAE